MSDGRIPDIDILIRAKTFDVHGDEHLQSDSDIELIAGVPGLHKVSARIAHTARTACSVPRHGYLGESHTAGAGLGPRKAGTTCSERATLTLSGPEVH